MRKLLVLAALALAFTSISNVYACGDQVDGPRVGSDTKTNSSTDVEVETSTDAEASES